MADKTSPTRLMSPEVSRDQSAISEDITRIVSYLNTKRSVANERTSDLVQEITHRRDEIASRLEQSAARELPNQLSALAQSIPDKTVAETRANPILAERFHAFCRDLDVLLDSFRARVEGEKPVRH